jgi:hypothetical protein
MKKKDLLTIKDLSATPEMIRTARENQIEVKRVKSPWGHTWTERTCKYKRYLSAAVKTYNCVEVINTCENSSRLGGTVFCDYLDKHGKSRGCKPSECTGYVRKGEK